jgi:MYXO-CTERM domain-containing protein
VRRAGSFAVLIVASSPAFGYVRSTDTAGLCTWWSTRGHGFQIDAQGTPDVAGGAAFQAIRQSFLAWSGVSCSDLVFPDQGLSEDPQDRVAGFFPGQKNSNLILFRTRSCARVVPAGDPCLASGGCSNTHDCWDHGDAAIAITTTTSVQGTGQIEDADTELNDAPQSDGARFVFTANDGAPCSQPDETGCVLYDIQNTMTHEAGHSLGLAHSPDPAATMFATAPKGEISKRVLGADDIQGICDIYPLDKPTVTCAGDPAVLTSGAANGGCGCSQTQTGPGAALGALIALLALRRRVTRRCRRYV